MSDSKREKRELGKAHDKKEKKDRRGGFWWTTPFTALGVLVISGTRG